MYVLFVKCQDHTLNFSCLKFSLFTRIIISSSQTYILDHGELQNGCVEVLLPKHVSSLVCEVSISFKLHHILCMFIVIVHQRPYTQNYGGMLRNFVAEMNKDMQGPCYPICHCQRICFILIGRLSWLITQKLQIELSDFLIFYFYYPQTDNKLNKKHHEH